MRPSFTLSFIAACLTAVGSFAPAVSADEAQPAQKLELSQRTIKQLTRNPDKFLQQVVQRLYQIAPDGEVTAEKRKAYETFARAQQRARRLGQVLAADLDGNGAIGPEEFAAHLRYIKSSQRARVAIMRSQADTDGDMTLSFSEITAHINGELDKNDQQRNRRADAYDPMNFDLNRDGVVNVEELTRAIYAVATDTDMAQVIAIIPRTASRQQVSCKLPVPPDDAEVVLLGGYEGASISTVATGGLDQETSTAVLTIEKGEKPLFIIAGAFDNIVWLIEGDIGRVAGFVGQPGRKARGGPGVGVAGLDPSIVSFIPGRSCFEYFKGASDGKSRIARARVSSALGRDVDHMIGAYELDRVAVPSGEGSEKKRRNSRRVVVSGGRRFVLTDDGPKLLEEPAQNASGSPANVDRRTREELRRFYPGGIIEIAAKDVVAPGPVLSYDVLPQQAGLAQLMTEGSVSRTADGFYHIIKPIARFPAGLNGAHSVKFLLGRGVPMPAGSPGHSSVWSEETGKCMSGVRCR